MTVIVTNEKGFPVMFADVPNSGAAKIAAAQRSGNDAHDTRSGKFAPKAKPEDQAKAPPNTDPNEYARMFAAVREAARSLNLLDQESVKVFLASRATSPDQVDIVKFMAMIRQQRINDIVDVLSERLKNSDNGFKIIATDDAISSSMNQLEPTEVQQIENVLISRGIDKDKVIKFFDSKDKSSGEV